MRISSIVFDGIRLSDKLTARPKTVGASEGRACTYHAEVAREIAEDVHGRGPAFVWYFGGFPHVHIWVHVAENPDVPVTSYFG
jgi:hypothetical protein